MNYKVRSRMMFLLALISASCSGVTSADRLHEAALTSQESAHAKSDLQTGILDDPCLELPPEPAEVVAFKAHAAIAQARNKPSPVPNREQLAVYAAWRRSTMLLDFFGLCHYQEANAGLPLASTQRIVLFGDSITEAWGAKRPGFFHGDRINRGISGQTTAQMLGRFRADVIDLDPAIVQILAGTNDIAGNTGPTTLGAIEHNTESMVELARANGIKVVLGTILPTQAYSWNPRVDPVPQILKYNEWLRSYARREDIALIDYYTALDNGEGGLAPTYSLDGVHPTGEGYAIMEPMLECAITVAFGYSAICPDERIAGGGQ